MTTFTGAMTTESSLRMFIKRYPLMSMYTMMFAMAWSIMIPQALYSQGILSAPLPEFLEILTGWAPAIAAILVSAVAGGRSGVRELLHRFSIWKVGIQWYLLSLFLLAGIILGGIGVHILFGGARPVIPAAGNPFWDIGLTFVVFVLLGFIFNTEEVAWRGFALPRLQARYGTLTAVVLIAIPEVLLHLPLFWVKENPFFQTVGLYWFSAFTVAAVFIYAYIFNNTKGSLILVTVLHASQNAWSNLLSDNTAQPFRFTVILIWIVALALIFATRGKLGYRQE